jgi:ABC-type nitrate/sulfonate/bicarbonate transport system permease component
MAQSFRDLMTLRNDPPPMVRRALGALGIAIVIFVWWLLTYGATAESRVISPVLLPSPGEVLGSVPVLFRERGLIESTIATLKRVLSGFGLAIIVGVPLGILAGSYRLFDALTGPLSLFARNVPVAVLIPLTILWFGIDETQKTMFIFIATVPFVFFDAVRAVTDVHQRYVETAQTLGASSRQVVTKVLIALALPDIFSSLRSLFGLAFGYIMLAELVNAKYGLGYLLLTSQRRALTDNIFAILILIGLLAYGIDRLLLWFERGLFPYREASE